MRPARTHARFPLAAAAAVLASLLLAGCDALDALDPTPDVPPGEPPPAGFAAEMVDTHNAVRADPASVGGSPVPNPALTPLAWSSSAAATAQAWADGCTYAHNAGRGALGENIAATAPAGMRAAAYIVGLWASEAPFYTYATNTCASGEVCGHYTQVVWRDTTVVGCAVRTCTTGSPFGSGSWDFWVCNYAPPGNWVGRQPY